MACNFRFLHIEDNPLDAEIVEAELRKAWPDCCYELICTEKELCAALSGEAFNAILSNYSLPGFDGMEAMSIVLRKYPETPFIFLTGAMGEEVAIDTLRNGATDCILKTSISKLIPAVARALRDSTAGSELKRNYERLVLMQEVSQFHAATVQELLDFALEKVIAITESGIGYIYHYNEESQEFVLNSWSSGVMDACSVAERQSVYKLEMTGIWGEVVRQRKPLVLNNYEAPNPFEKGYPEGHVPISNFMSIPVFENDRIVAVVGVTNKAAPYEHTDLLQLDLMMDGVWKVAARLKMEEQISRAGKEWQNTFDSISDSIALIDTEQRVVRCNLATTRVLELNFHDILNQPCWRVFHGADTPISDCPMAKSILSHHKETSTIRHKDRWLEVTVEPMLSDAGLMTGAVHIVRDVTEQRNMERVLQKQTSVLSGVMESTNSAVFSVDSSFCYTSFNTAHSRTMKTLYDADIKLGSKLFDYMTSEDAAIAETNLKRSMNGEAFSVVSKSGDEMRMRPVFEISHNPIKDIKGGVEGVAVFANDISERTKAEEEIREMQSQLMQQDKLATIGQLAAGVAHEINNPMGFVGSNMATLARYIEKYNSYITAVEQELCSISSGVLPEQIQKIRNKLKLDYIIRDISGLVDENNEGIDRVRRIVQDLRTFSRADSSAVDSADLNSCIDCTINIVINEIKYAAELKREYGDLPMVPCNSQQINQVFMNLLMNAAHAIQAKGEEIGEIVIRTWSDHDNAFISVSDTGCGIEPDNWRKIFDAFYTTKEIGKGTGLGLSISSGIIRKHGGEITLSSEVGVGSTFTVRLPLNPAHRADEVLQ